MYRSNTTHGLRLSIAGSDFPTSLIISEGFGWQRTLNLAQKRLV